MSTDDNSKKPKNTAIELLALGIDLLDGKPGEKGEKGDIGPIGPAGKDSNVPGPKGDKGDTGPAGKDSNVPGPKGKDGKDGKDGKQGPKGDKGDQGDAGLDAPAVTPEFILDVTLPLIVQNVQKSVSTKTYSASEIEGLTEFVAENSGGADTFETVSSNLDAEGSTLAYTGDNLTSITYANGVVKTLNYTGDNLTSVVLSGSTPAGIDLTKTLSYTGDNLTGVAYS